MHQQTFFRRTLKLTWDSSQARALLQDTLDRATRSILRDVPTSRASARIYGAICSGFLDWRKAYERRYRADLTHDELANIPSPDWVIGRVFARWSGRAFNMLSRV